MEELKKLAQDWLAAKAEEAAANARRFAIEQQIVAITGKKDEGAQTTKGEGCSVTVTGVINRKMDWKKWDEVKASIPAELHPVKQKPELDEKGVKWLKENRPDIYALLPIEVKPGKAGIEVKILETQIMEPKGQENL